MRLRYVTLPPVHNPRQTAWLNGWSWFSLRPFTYNLTRWVGMWAVGHIERPQILPCYGLLTLTPPFGRFPVGDVDGTVYATVIGATVRRARSDEQPQGQRSAPAG